MKVFVDETSYFSENINELEDILKRFERKSPCRMVIKIQKGFVRPLSNGEFIGQWIIWHRFSIRRTFFFLTKKLGHLLKIN